MATKKRRKSTAKRRVKSRRIRARKNPIAAKVARKNPIRRRRRRSMAGVSAKAMRRIRRRRRNPIGKASFSVKGITNNFLMPSVTAATGAVLLDILMGYLPIPAQYKTGNLKYATKAVGAVGMAMLASGIVTRSTANAFGVGALTVVLHDLFKDLVLKNVPGIKMGEYVGLNEMGYYSPAYPAGIPNTDLMLNPDYTPDYSGLMDEYVANGGGMGEYVGY